MNARTMIPTLLAAMFMLGPNGTAEDRPAHDRLRAKARELVEKSERLADERKRKIEEARKLREKNQRVMAEAAEIGEPGGRSSDEQKLGKRRLPDLHKEAELLTEKIEDLTREVAHEDAEKLERKRHKVRQLIRHFKHGIRPRPCGLGSEPWERLRAEIAEIHLADQHEQAQTLYRETRRMERRWREAQSDRGPHRRPDPRPLAEAVERRTQEMRELKRIINDLRERVEKLGQDGE